MCGLSPEKTSDPHAVQRPLARYRTEKNSLQNVWLGLSNNGHPQWFGTKYDVACNLV